MRNNFKVEYTPYTLIFREPGGTSRGVLHKKLTYFLRLVSTSDPTAVGYGEIPVFKGLSRETVCQLEEKLQKIVQFPDLLYDKEFLEYSSLIMGVETALNSLSYHGLVFPSSFTEKKLSIPINGLIWMGSYDKMLERIREKLKENFACIKIKIGAINWEEEISLIKYIRNCCGNDIVIRVDANGAFTMDDCFSRLEELAQLGVHSIEQPLPPRDIEALQRVCRESPLAVALDEQLIGIPVSRQRDILLDFIKPQYIVLKPALCYGFSGTSDWIERAENRGIGWWITSALESSLGLNAIAQFTGSLAPAMTQGLGTGSLFTNNLDSPLELKGDRLFYKGPAWIYYKQLENLDWIK